MKASIEFYARGTQFRFRRLDKRNLIIEQLKPNKKGNLVWVRVSGYHSVMSIQRELVELIDFDTETLEEYYKEMLSELKGIRQHLESLVE